MSPLHDLHEDLPDFLAAEVLARLDPADFAPFSRRWAPVDGGGAGRQPAARGEEFGGAAQAQRVCRVRRAAGLGEGERVPVGGGDV